MVLSAMSFALFAVMFFTDVADYQDYVILHKGPDYTIKKVKSNPVKAAFFVKSENTIFEKNVTYHTMMGCNPSTTQPAPVPPPPQTRGQVEDWGRIRIHAKEAWAISTGETIKVCILDTGIDQSHPDLSYVAGQDFTGEGSFNDSFGHGTHVAGIIAAKDNQNGTVGTSKAQLYIGKVLGSNGSGSTDGIVNGIRWCKQEKVQVINMSLGSSQYSQALDYAVNDAAQAGIYVVVAAGNESGPVAYPAMSQGAIAVSATTQQDTLARFSNYGPKIAVAAPGENILSSVPMAGCQICNGQKEMGYMSGTSMATPYVAGCIALMLGASNSVLNTDSTNDPYRFGKGIINCLNSVQKTSGFKAAQQYMETK